MKYITLFGIVAGLANVIIHYNNDPAFWGWVSATSWATCLFIQQTWNLKNED